MMASGPCRAALMKYLGSEPGRYKTRAAQAIARRRFRQRDFFRRSLAAQAQPGPARRSLDTRRNYEGQRALIADFYPCMLDAKHVEYLAGLRQNGVAVVGRNPGLHRDLEAAAVPRLDGHVHIRAHALATMPGFPGPRRFFSRIRHS